MAARTGLFKDCPTLPPTAIFHLTHRFKQDLHPRKLNLGVGAYRDEALKPVVFGAVRKAEAAIVAQHNDKEYLPVTGLASFTVSEAGGVLVYEGVCDTRQSRFRSRLRRPFSSAPTARPSARSVSPRARP